MFINKFLMNIAVCVVGLTSVSYGANDALRTPEKTSARLGEHTPISGRASALGSPASKGCQRLAVESDFATKEEALNALLLAQKENVTIRNNVKDFLKALAQILSIDPEKPVKAHSEEVKNAAGKLVSSIQTIQTENEVLKAKIKATERKLNQWRFGVMVSGVVLVAFFYQTAFENGTFLFSSIVNFVNSFGKQ